MKWKLKGMSRYGHLTGICDYEKEYTSNKLVDKLNQLEEEVEHWRKEFYQMWYGEYCGSDEAKIEMFEKVFKRPYNEEEFEEIIWG